MLRPATVDDYVRFYGKPPLYPDTWIGLVSDIGYMLAGIGGMYWGIKDRWWACLDKAPGCKQNRDLAKAGKWLIETARSMQIDLYAVADPKIASAETLLRHFAFEPTDETFNDMTIWKLSHGS